MTAFSSSWRSLRFLVAREGERHFGWAAAAIDAVVLALPLDAALVALASALRMKRPRTELGQTLFTLIVWPSGPGRLANADGASEIELYLTANDVKRICRVAPHLISATTWPNDVWSEIFGSTS